MLADDIAAFVAAYRVTRAAVTADGQARRLRHFHAWLRQHGVHRWPALTPDHVDEFMRSLADDGLATVTQQDYYWCLRTFMAWLLDRGRMLTDPMRHLEPILSQGQEPLPPPPVAEADIARLFDLLPRRNPLDLRNRLHVELCYSAGLRLMETLNLDVRDLDVDARTILVRHGKGDRDRIVPMMGGLRRAADEYLAVRRDLVRGPDTGALLLGRDGRRVDRQVLGRLLRRVARILRVRVHPHLLRHSIAVHLLRGGTDIRYIQAFLGHSQLDTTKIYLRLVPGHLREDYDDAMPVFPVELGPPEGGATSLVPFP